MACGTRQEDRGMTMAGQCQPANRRRRVLARLRNLAAAPRPAVRERFERIGTAIGYERASRLAGPLLRLAARIHSMGLALRRVPVRGSVLQIGFPIHVVYQQSELLKQNGVRSRFLAINDSPAWDRRDFLFHQTWGEANAIRAIWREALCLLRVMNRFEVLHFHNGRCISRNGWLVKQWRALGRPIVVHWRGCDIRNYHRNVALHPAQNICQACDYDRLCLSDDFVHWQQLFRSQAHVHLVTTPDLKDFIPEAHHLRFTLPVDDMIDPAPEEPAPGRPGKDRPLKIIHITNHPGIEGTREIEAAIERLRSRGYAIEFTWLHGVSFDEVAKAYAEADLTIGKMKMGHYANAQIESLYAGVPCITHVREEYLTDDIRESGLILSQLEKVEETILELIENPDILREKRRISRASIARLHDGDAIAQRLSEIYDEARAKAKRARVPHSRP
jgi:glycosyltransferase involved in cell wall biosynthesis